MLSSSVSIFIPTLNAEKYLNVFLKLLTEIVFPSSIYIIDSSSDDDTVAIAKEFGVQVHTIERREFNHGKTRNLSLQLSSSDFIVFMTQDAVPANLSFLSTLIAPFHQDPLVAATYARQLPRQGAGLLEQLDRSIKYSDHDLVQSKETLAELGSRTYFLSNSCAAYRRSIFQKLEGFPENEIMGEDAIFAKKAVLLGYKIIYVSDSKVYHSHDYTLAELFKRYFDTGVYRTRTLNSFDDSKVKGDVTQGSSYAYQVLSYLFKNNKFLLIPEFIVSLCFSFLGYSVGKKYLMIPVWFRRKLSMHSFYWQSNEQI